MTVFLGKTQLVGNDVQIQAPMGFDTLNGVRITNYTGDVLVLNGISGENASTEYLMPLQQMIYKTDNVERVPLTHGLVLGNGIAAPQVFVEWSDDMLNDFIGTYPTSVTQVQSLQAPGFSSVNSLTLVATGTTYTIPANPSRQSITLINSDAAALVQWQTSGDTGWATNPAIAPGNGRTLDSTTAIYLRTNVAGSKVEWFED